MTISRFVTLSVYLVIRAFLLAVGVLLFVSGGLADLFAPLALYSECDSIPPLSQRLPQDVLVITCGLLLSLPLRVVLRHRVLMVAFFIATAVVVPTCPGDPRTDPGVESI